MKCEKCKHNTIKEENGEQFSWCEVKGDNLDIQMERDCRSFVQATNADRIRSMSDEQLAKWLCSIMTAECCDQRCPARDICNLGDNGLVKWMKQPAEEDQL